MILIPAIDLKEGNCVRLRQGRMEDETIFASDPVEMASRWIEQGAQRLHLVDLNGAFAGKPVNADPIRRIVRQFPDIPVQVGGGIRDQATVQTYLEMGVRYAIIGTQAVANPQFVRSLCEQFPGHIIVGLDARQDKVATHGWAADSEHSLTTTAQQFEAFGVSAIVYTDISRDGMMQGCNVATTDALARKISIPVIASGGISSLTDIQALHATRNPNIFSAVIGRALYEGAIDLITTQHWLNQNS